MCILEESIKNNENPLDLDPKKLWVIDTSLFIKPFLPLSLSVFFPSHFIFLLVSHVLTQTFLQTFLPCLFPNDGSGFGFWVLWWKWAQDIYIFEANPLLMCPRPLIAFFYLWVWHVGFKGVNYSSVLERQLSTPP